MSRATEIRSHLRSISLSDPADGVQRTMQHAQESGRTGRSPRASTSGEVPAEPTQVHLALRTKDRTVQALGFSVVAPYVVHFHTFIIIIVNS